MTEKTRKFWSLDLWWLCYQFLILFDILFLDDQNHFYWQWNETCHNLSPFLNLSVFLKNFVTLGGLLLIITLCMDNIYDILNNLGISPLSILFLNPLVHEHISNHRNPMNLLPNVKYIKIICLSAIGRFFYPHVSEL